jgi:hypothetical protein
MAEQGGTGDEFVDRRSLGTSVILGKKLVSLSVSGWKSEKYGIANN